MNFLNPIILFGLVTASLPVIIHLLSRRKARNVAFPSIAFLEKMRSERIRRLRLKQIIILILRTLIIACIIFAFARPALRSAFFVNARTQAAVVVDTSMSMTYIDNGEMLFGAAQRDAKVILDILGRNDAAAILLTGGDDMVMPPGPTTDKIRLAKGIDGLEPVYATNDPGSSLNRALDIVTSGGAPNREVYYITDGDEDAFPDSLASDARTVRLYPVIIGPEERAGVAITSLNLDNTMVSPGGTVTFTAAGVSMTETPILDLIVNGERKDREQATTGPDGGFTASLAFTPEDPGWYSVSVTADDGRFEAAETRRTVLHVSHPSNVLLVGESEDDLLFLRRAMDHEREESMFNVAIRTAGSLLNSDIASADAIVLSGVGSLPLDVYHALRNAVLQKGTGLMVFPSPEMDKTLYASGIFRDIIPVKSDGWIDLTEGSDSGYSAMERFDLSHPLFRGITREGEFLKPEIRRYLRFQPGGESRTVSWLSGDAPAVVEARSGQGHTMLFAVDATLATSDLPLTGVFVPLFIRGLQFLTGSFISGNVYENGDIVREPLPLDGADRSVVVVPEDGAPFSVKPAVTQSGTAVTDLRADEPGFYRISVDGEATRVYAVNAPSDEVVYNRVDTDMLTQAYNNVSVSVVDGTDNLESVIQETRYGTELFAWVLTAALAMIALEMIISRKV